MEHKIMMGDKEVLATRKQVETLSVLSILRKGGFATVKGYVPTTDYIKSPVVNISFISRFSVTNLYNRKIKALKALSFGDIVVKGEKLVALPIAEQETLFKSCLDTMVGSMEKTLSGIRDDAHRIAHDTFYAHTADGIKVHLRTHKVGKETVLDLVNGLPVVESIMVSMIETGRTVVQEGERKVVNSGTKVLMDKCINKALNLRSVGFATLSLKADNFESLTMGGESFTPDNILAKVRETVRMVGTDDLTNILETEEEVKV